MIRWALIAVTTVLLAIGVTVKVATRDSVVSEQMNDNLNITTLTINNAKIYLVERDGKRIMIDSGNPGDEDKIESYMRELGIEPASIDYLILTHGHLDHVGTAAYFQNRYDIEVIVGRGDTTMLSQAVQQPLCPTSLLAKAIDMSLQGKTYSTLHGDILVDAPFDLAPLGVRGNIIPMPGHTLGTLLVSFDDVIFVGDLIRGGLLKQGTPTRHFFMCDLQDNNLDISTTLELGAFKYWYTGHFGPLLAKDIRNSGPQTSTREGL